MLFAHFFKLRSLFTSLIDIDLVVMIKYDDKQYRVDTFTNIVRCVTTIKTGDTPDPAPNTDPTAVHELLVSRKQIRHIDFFRSSERM